MRLKRKLVIFVGLMLIAMFISVNVQAESASNKKSITQSLSSLQPLSVVLENVKSPDIKNPQWLDDQIAAEEAAKNYVAVPNNVSGSVYTYDVSTAGNIVADLTEFKNLSNQTLNDNRGWARMGVSFQEVASGGNFSLVLSEASQVPSFFPSICSIYWSCQVGRYVIINQDRWLYASDAWNAGGGSLRDYRNMVINHETGHWLGHPHEYCGGAGQLAPVMQQQSIDLQGCSFNPWPLGGELWSNQ